MLTVLRRNCFKSDKVAEISYASQWPSLNDPPAVAFRTDVDSV